MFFSKPPQLPPASAWDAGIELRSISVKRKLSEARVFALKGYTVKCEGDKFFVSPTGLNQWAGPYKSLHHATTAIARKLSREYADRNTRLQRGKERLQRRRLAPVAT
jgi:hypothetical protein